MKTKAKKIDLSNMSALLVLIVLVILLSIAEPAFHSFANFINILQQVTVYAVLAVGVNIVIFTGGIDISVGSVVAFTGIVMGKIIVEGGAPSIVGIIAALAIGLGCGLFNGIMISKFRLQPMIAAQAGTYAAENIEDGQICYLEGVPGVAALDDRLAGFKDQCPDYNIVASQTAKCDRNEAYNVMQNVLNANPEVNVVWAVNAEMGQGAIQAIDQMKATGISVFDFDASSDDLAAIEEGTLTGTVAQYPNKQAEAAIQACLDVLDGKTLEEHTETPSLLVTKDNLDDYKEEMGL